MSTRFQVCAWIAAVGLVAPSAAAAQDRTERDIVDLIVREGPQARAIRAETEATHREQLARLAYPNPSVTYSREGAGFTEFFQAEQSLPVFGVRGALARAGLAATAAAEAERDARLWQLRSQAATVLARLAAEQVRLDATRALVRQIEGLTAILRTREREGEGSRFDRLRAEVELRDTRLLVTEAAAAVAEARATLTSMLPDGASVTRIVASPDAPAPAMTRETLVARATTARAELRALHQLAQRATFEAEAARRSRLPSPNVFGGLKRADGAEGRERGGVIGLSLAIPLFDTGARESARWSAEGARIEAERLAIERRIRGEIGGALEVLVLRQGAVTLAQPEAVDELVQIAEVAYREGEVGILELLDSVRTASRARMRLIDTRLDARLAEIALERAVGETLWP
jgi:cobalt-zinc-cadmium efflux system outer membrane protein